MRRILKIQFKNAILKRVLFNYGIKCGKIENNDILISKIYTLTASKYDYHFIA